MGSKEESYKDFFRSRIFPAFYAKYDKTPERDPEVDRFANNFIELMKIIRYIGDGHSNIFLPISKPEFKQTLPVQFYFFEEGLYIISADPKYKELLGSQVLQFEKKNVNDVINALEPLNGRDNKMTMYGTLALFDAISNFIEYTWRDIQPVIRLN